MLFPNVSKPLYEQLKDTLRSHIKSGLYKPGEILPGERQLMDIYKVSRNTVRQAIGDLVREQILCRKQGSGTFVAEKVVEHPTSKLYGLVEELILTGHEISMKLIDHGMKDPSDDIAEALNLSKDEQIFFYHRLIMEHDAPLLLTKSYIHSRLSHMFTVIDANITRDVIYEHLEGNGYQISHAIQHYGAGNPTLSEAQYLDCDVTTPILIVHRTTFLKGGHPVIYSRHLYRQDYSLTINLER